MVFSFENKKLVKISNELVPSANWTILGDGVDSNTILCIAINLKKIVM